MLSTKTRMLLQSVRTLAARGASQRLESVAKKIHPADMGLVFGHLRKSEALQVLQVTEEYARRAEILSETEDEVAVELLNQMEPIEISKILQEMYSDDAAALLDHFDDDLREAVLHDMADDDSKEVEERLDYGEETAGRIMVPDYIGLTTDTTIGDAMAALRSATDEEIVYYLYVVSASGKLEGIVSMRQLIMSKPEKPLSEVMTSDIIAVHANDDQEDVARLVARYNLLAIPVLDELGQMLGIITVDDIIDIIKDEATEDMMRMAGTTEDPMAKGSVIASVKTRWPWLLASWFGGMFALYVTNQFEESLTKMVLLAGFIPIVLGMGGNVGTQSSILVVRGLAIRLLDNNQIWGVTWREIRIGALLGLIYGVLLGSAVIGLDSMGLVSSDPVSPYMMAAVVGIGIFSSMLVATVIGSITPLLLDRLSIDPAIATGPLVTTSVDVLGVLVYFSIATALLDL